MERYRFTQKSCAVPATEAHSTQGPTPRVSGSARTVSMRYFCGVVQFRLALLSLMMRRVQIDDVHAVPPVFARHGGAVTGLVRRDATPIAHVASILKRTFSQAHVRLSLLVEEAIIRRSREALTPHLRRSVRDERARLRRRPSVVVHDDPTVRVVVHLHRPRRARASRRDVTRVRAGERPRALPGGGAGASGAE